MAAQLFVNVKSKKNSDFVAIGKRQTKFYLKNRNFPVKSELDIENVSKTIIPESKKSKKFEFVEKELHPFLSYFAANKLKCYTKSISHSLSNKREYGEWVHPDIVGCSFFFEGWNNEVLELKTSIGEVSIKLYSFELKRELNSANLRESFFQTVSNSSWANEAYLVTSKISDNIMSELSRLSSSFGIGIILLNITKVDHSDIILPA